MFQRTQRRLKQHRLELVRRVADPLRIGFRGGPAELALDEAERGSIR